MACVVRNPELAEKENIVDEAYEITEYDGANAGDATHHQRE
jgi:hypothetical protein